jgi:hypothetical protein
MSDGCVALLYPWTCRQCRATYGSSTTAAGKVTARRAATATKGHYLQDKDSVTAFNHSTLTQLQQSSNNKQEQTASKYCWLVMLVLLTYAAFNGGGPSCLCCDARPFQRGALRAGLVVVAVGAAEGASAAGRDHAGDHEEARRGNCSTQQGRRQNSRFEMCCNMLKVPLPQCVTVNGHAYGHGGGLEPWYRSLCGRNPTKQTANAEYKQGLCMPCKARAEHMLFESSLTT